MKVYGILLLLCSFLISCADNSNPIVDRRDEIPFGTIIHSSDAFSNQELATITLRSKSEEEEFLAKYPMSTTFPEIDYRRDMVIGILLGLRPSVSISVTIDQVKNIGRALKVYAHEFHPTGLYMAIGYPAHLIVLRRSHHPVVFAPIKIIRESIDSVIYGKWLFRYFEDVTTGRRDILPSIIRDVTIEFHKPDGFNGNGPCNQYVGSFTLSINNGLKISSLGATKMSCGNIIDEWEGRYFRALMDVNSFLHRENELKLFFDKRRQAIVYSRHEIPQLTIGAIEGTVKYFIDTLPWVGGEVEPSGFILDNFEWLYGEPSYRHNRVYVKDSILVPYLSRRVHVFGIIDTLFDYGIVIPLRQYPHVEVQSVRIID
ncbi:MAG: META domain-containing protein [Bacteroidota bacterium]|nr:META domain-containing protein [Bacteroidota bacterium]